MHSAHLSSLRTVLKKYKKGQEELFLTFTLLGVIFSCVIQKFDKKKELEQPFSAGDIRVKEKRRDQVRTEFTNCPEWPLKTSARTSLDRHENKGKKLKWTPKRTTTATTTTLQTQKTTKIHQHLDWHEYNDKKYNSIKQNNSYIQQQEKEEGEEEQQQ